MSPCDKGALHRQIKLHLGHRQVRRPHIFNPCSIPQRDARAARKFSIIK